jgi:hypothetical protein
VRINNLAVARRKFFRYKSVPPVEGADVSTEQNRKQSRSMKILLVLPAAVVCLVGCAGLYIPVVGVGQNSDGSWSFMFGGGGGAVGAAGLGASCASACTGDPNGEACTKFRELTKQTCDIK